MCQAEVRIAEDYTAKKQYKVRFVVEAFLAFPELFSWVLRVKSRRRLLQKRGKALHYVLLPVVGRSTRTCTYHMSMVPLLLHE